MFDHGSPIKNLTQIMIHNTYKSQQFLLMVLTCDKKIWNLAHCLCSYLPDKVFTYSSFSEWSMIEYFGSYIFITKKLTKFTIPYSLKTQIHILMAFQGTCMLCSSVFYQWYFCPMFISSSLIKITFYHHDDDRTVDHNVTHLVTPSYYTNKFKHHFKY